MPQLKPTFSDVRFNLQKAKCWKLMRHRLPLHKKINRRVRSRGISVCHKAKTHSTTNICMLPFDVRTIFSDHKEISGEEKVERVIRVSGTKILVPFGHLVHVLPYALSKCI